MVPIQTEIGYVAVCTKQSPVTSLASPIARNAVAKSTQFSLLRNSPLRLARSTVSVGAVGLVTERSGADLKGWHLSKLLDFAPGSWQGAAWLEPFRWAAYYCL